MPQNKLHMFSSADQNTCCIYWFLIKAQIHVINQIHRGARWAQLVECLTSCRAGGHGFDSWGWTNSQSLKITEKWRYCLCSANGETFAWLGWPLILEVPSPAGDVKVESPICNFVLNTLTLNLNLNLNLFNTDTKGTEPSVHFTEVSLL